MARHDLRPRAQKTEASTASPPPAAAMIDLNDADPHETIRRLQRINEALINRVEGPLHQASNPYSLFQAAVTLEAEILARTSELNAALDALERTNHKLAVAHETLTAANRMKTRFFTAVGHDALQPLHAARLSLSTLGEMTDDKSRRRLVAHIDDSLSSIEEIIKTVLDISRLEAGVMTPKRAVIGLADFLEHLYADFEPMARLKGLEFHGQPSDFTIVSDAMMLRRILRNLIANAVRYTSVGGIRIRAKSIGDLVRIEVWDSGMGVRPQDQGIIFNEFQRGEGVGAAGDPGLGLGLSIVQRMADVLGHPIGMMSRVGRGSCFHISAPLARAEERAEGEAARNASPAPFGMPKARIVIIDDNNASLVALAELLRRWSCTPHVAADMESVAAYAAGEPTPDLIIADFHLDHGELGTKAVSLLREKFDHHIPAVILTADRSQAVADAIREARCELMNKPARPAELRALVSHLLG